MKKRYADVIVSITGSRLDHPFTYAVPPELQDRAVIGSVVRIPFGHSRVTEGYITRFSDSCGVPPERLRAILDVVTDGETADARLVRLAAWMSRTYGSTLIQALKTVVPVRKKYAPRTAATVSLTDRESAEKALELAVRRHYQAKERVLRLMLAGKSGVSLGALEKEASVPLSVIRGLEGDGVLRVDTEDVYRRVSGDAEVLPPDHPTAEQQSVISAVRGEWAGADRPVLINGVTGSGKTVVYTELVADVLAKGQQAIVLIPEIALTWQTVLRFVKRFGDKVSFLHSRLSGGERYDQMKAARKGDIQVMVGPRSALFTPFPDLGLIVIDEEHEETYHSETAPRYHARETAIERGRIEHAHVVLGSATPSVTAAKRAADGLYLGLRLEGRYGGSRLPDARIVDMRAELADGNRTILSRALRDEMAEALDEHAQIMLFLNRRGYAGAWTCRSCGHVVRCPHCDVSLTQHIGGRLVCHYCGYETPEMHRCPVCGSPFIGGLSIGTEQVEAFVRKSFPSAGVLRMDADTTKGKEGYEAILTQFAGHEKDILIGTQMIVKGHDFPGVTLVGVLMADLSLNESDFRSSEHTYQLITQAVGRAGRGQRPGRAVIQTYRPEHFAIQAAARQDYDTFYKEEISYRKLMEYPPCGSMTAILGSAPDEELLTRGMRYLRKYLDRIDPHQTLHAIGPAPQSIGRIRDQYRQVIYIRHSDPERLIRAKDMLEEYIEMNSGFRKIRIQFDLCT